MSSTLRVRGVVAQVRLKEWAQSVFDTEVTMTTAGIYETEVLFDITEAGTNQAPHLTQEAFRQFEALGPTFSLVDHGTHVRITVRSPTADEQAALLKSIAARTQLLAASVWPLWLAALLLAISLGSLIWSICALSAHIEGYGEALGPLFGYAVDLLRALFL